MALALIATCLVCGALWNWQSWRYSGTAESGAVQFGWRGGTPYLRGLNDFLINQTLHDGKAAIHYFALLAPRLYESEELGRIERLESRVLIPQENWIDLVARDTQRGRIAFRISRCEGVDSGWYVWRGSRCVIQQPVDLAERFPIGQVEDARWRADLKRYSWRSPNQGRALIEEEFQSLWAEIALDMDGTQFEAWADGESLGSLDLTAEIDPEHPGLTPEGASLEFLAEGLCGIRAADRPPVRVDHIRAEGFDADGEPVTLAEDFSPPVRSTYVRAMSLWKTVRGFLLASIAATAALIWLLPGVGAVAVMRWLIGTTLFVSLICLWDEARNLIDFIFDLEGHRTLQRVLWVLLCALFVLRRRRNFRFRVDRWKERVLSRRGALIWILITVAAAVVGLWSYERIHWPLPEPWIYRGVEAEPWSQRWSPDHPMHIDVLKPDRAAISVELNFEVCLESSDSVLELYFDHWFESPAMIPQWRAIRITPEGIAFVASEGFNPAVEPPGLAVGETHTIDLRIEGSEIALTVREGDLGDGPVVAEVSNAWDWHDAGGMGAVARGGSGEVRVLGGTIGEMSRSGVERRSLNTQVYDKPLQFLLVVIAFATVVSLALGLLALWVGRAPGAVCFQWGLSTLVAAVGAGIWRWFVQFNATGGLLEWLVGNVFIASLMAATVMWFLFWICNQKSLRRFGLMAPLFLLALLVELEMYARQSPMREFWQVRTRTGYVVRDFLFADQGARLIWGAYTGFVEYNGEQCPIERPERGERRIFCIGGSSTQGSGVDRQADSYPSILENQLHLRTDDPRWNVVNAGHPSFTINSDLLRWRRDIRVRNPDAIIICAGGNDNLALAGSSTRQREVMELVQWLNEPSLSSAFMQRVYGLRLLVGARTVIDGFRGNELLRYQVNTPPEDFELSLRSIIEEALEDGVEIILAPEIVVEALTRDDHELRGHHAVMERLAEEYDLTLIDTVGAMRQWPLDVLMVDYIHPNRLGNELLASAMADAILAMDWVNR